MKEIILGSLVFSSLIISIIGLLFIEIREKLEKKKNI